MSYLEVARRTLAKLEEQSEVIREDTAKCEVESHPVADVPQTALQTIDDGQIDEGLAGEWCNSDQSDKSDKTDYWWSILTPEEREELKPRPIKRRCPWCKQIEHTAICNELRPRRLMPLGKYKGHAIEDLPLDYVHWLAGANVRLGPDVRDEIYDRFGVVIHSE